METTTQTKQAIGWMLACPTPAGEKAYVMVVCGEFVAVGWGALRTADRSLAILRMQWKVIQRTSEEMARLHAIVQTKSKEDKGYIMCDEPRQKAAAELHPNFDTLLANAVGVRGSQGNLAGAVRNLFL
jgi:hypothetical protein